MISTGSASKADGKASQYAAMNAFGFQADQVVLGSDGLPEEEYQFKDPREEDQDSAQFNKDESTEYDAQEVADYWKKQEQKEKYKQEELLRLREQILSVAEHVTITGYTEVLIGEKDTPFEDEEDNQTKLKRINDQIRSIVSSNMAKLKNIVDPTFENPQGEFDVKKHVEDMERRLCNQYFDKLATIVKEDKKRRMNESASPKQFNMGKSPERIVSQSHLHEVVSNATNTQMEDKSNFQSFNNLLGRQTELHDKSQKSGILKMPPLDQKQQQPRQPHHFGSYRRDIQTDMGMLEKTENAKALNLRLGYKRLSEISQRNMQLLTSTKNRASSFLDNDRVNITNREFPKSQLSLINNNENKMASSSSNKLGANSTQVDTQLTLMPYTTQHNQASKLAPSSLSPMDQYGGKSSLQFVPSQKNTIDLSRTQRVDKNLQSFLDAKRDSAPSVFSLNHQLQGLQKNLVSLMFMGPYDKQRAQQQRIEEEKLKNQTQHYSNQKPEEVDSSIRHLQQDIMQDLREANSTSMLDNQVQEMNWSHKRAPSELSNKHPQSMDGPTTAIYNHGTFTGTFNIGATGSMQFAPNTKKQSDQMQLGQQRALGGQNGHKTQYEGQEKSLDDKPGAWRIDGASDSHMLNSYHNENDRIQKERKFIDLKQQPRIEGDSNRESSIFQDTLAWQRQRQLVNQDQQVREEDIAQFPQVFQSRGIADTEQAKLDQNLKLLEDRLQENYHSKHVVRLGALQQHQQLQASQGTSYQQPMQLSGPGDANNNSSKVIKVFADSRNEVTKNQSQLFEKVLEQKPLEDENQRRIRFKSSHISFISSLQAQRDQYAENLRKIDENNYGRDPRKVVQHAKNLARGISDERTNYNSKINSGGGQVSPFTRHDSSSQYISMFSMAPGQLQYPSFSPRDQPQTSMDNQQIYSDQDADRGDGNQVNQDYFVDANPSFSLQHLPQPSHLNTHDQLPPFPDPFQQPALPDSSQQPSQLFSQKLSPFDLHLYTSIHMNRLQQQRFNEYRERVRKLAQGKQSSGERGVAGDPDQRQVPGPDGYGNAFKIDLVAHSKSKMLKDMKLRKKQERFEAMQARLQNGDLNLQKLNQDSEENLKSKERFGRRSRKANHLRLKKPSKHSGLQIDQLSLPQLVTIDASRITSSLATPQVLQTFNNPVDPSLMAHDSQRRSPKHPDAKSQLNRLTMNRQNHQELLSQGDFIHKQVTITETNAGNQDVSIAEPTFKKSKSILDEIVMDDHNALKSLDMPDEAAKASTEMMNYLEDKRNELNIQEMPMGASSMNIQNQQHPEYQDSQELLIANSAAARKAVDFVADSSMYRDSVKVIDVNSESKSNLVDTKAMQPTIAQPMSQHTTNKGTLPVTTNNEEEQQLEQQKIVNADSQISFDITIKNQKKFLQAGEADNKVDQEQVNPPQSLDVKNASQTGKAQQYRGISNRLIIMPDLNGIDPATREADRAGQQIVVQDSSNALPNQQIPVHPFKHQKNSLYTIRKSPNSNKLNLDLMGFPTGTSHEMMNSRRSSDAVSATIEINAQNNPHSQIRLPGTNLVFQSGRSSKQANFGVVLSKVAKPKLKEISNVSGRQTQLTMIQSVESSQFHQNPKLENRSQSQAQVLHPSIIQPQMDEQEKKKSPREIIEEQRKQDQSQRLIFALNAIEDKKRKNRHFRNATVAAGLSLMGKSQQESDANIQSNSKQNLTVNMKDLTGQGDSPDNKNKTVRLNNNANKSKDAQRLQFNTVQTVEFQSSGGLERKQYQFRARPIAPSTLQNFKKQGQNRAIFKQEQERSPPVASKGALYNTINAHAIALNVSKDGRKTSADYVNVNANNNSTMQDNIFFDGNPFTVKAKGTVSKLSNNVVQRGKLDEDARVRAKTQIEIEHPVASSIDGKGKPQIHIQDYGSNKGSASQKPSQTAYSNQGKTSGSKMQIIQAGTIPSSNAKDAKNAPVQRGRNGPFDSMAEHLQTMDGPTSKPHRQESTSVNQRGRNRSDPHLFTQGLANSPEKSTDTKIAEEQEAVELDRQNDPEQLPLGQLTNRKYRGNDPRSIYTNAKREQELEERRMRVQQQRMRHAKDFNSVSGADQPRMENMFAPSGSQATTANHPMKLQPNRMQQAKNASALRNKDASPKQSQPSGISQIYYNKSQKLE